MKLLESLFGSPTVRSAARRDSRVRGRRPAELVESLEARTMMAAPPFAAGHDIVEMVTNYGNIWIELYTQETPNTVANFLKYVDATDTHAYKGSFAHRLIPGFVVQMGGFALDTNNNQGHIAEYPTVNNEVPAGAPTTWPAERRNLVRTVAMAKKGGDPDSASSEFYINLGDNTGDKPGAIDHNNGLDYQNGGFTVFGYIVQGWDVVQKITGLQVIDASGGDPNSPFTDLPVGPTYDPTKFLTNNEQVLLQDLHPITNPGWSQKPGANQTVNGAGKADGQTLFVTVNELGHAIAFHQASATAPWTVSDINIQSGGPTVPGKVYAWNDPKDGLFYASSATATGLLLFKRSADGFWSLRNLTSEAAGAVNIVSDITVFTSVDNIVYIGGLLANSEFALYSQTTAAPVNGNYVWTYANLSSRDLTPNGMLTPHFVGSLSSYVTSWNGLNVAGLDAAGDVQSIWWAPGLTHWNTSNLSDITGALPFTGKLTPYVTSWDAVNLAGTDANGNVVITWWVPSFGGNWLTNNLTTDFSGPPLVQNSITSFVTPWGGTNVAGLNAAGKIVVYWWAPGLTNWNVTVDLVPTAVQPATRVTGVASPDGTINLVAQGTNNDAIRYYWSSNTPSDPWVSQDLSTVATFF